jgi:hypothetical protein
MSRRSTKAIYQDRMFGLYHTRETRDEMEYSFKKRDATDIVFTLIHRTGSMSCFNMNEFLPQIKIWKDTGIVSRYSNIRKITINNTECYMFIVQKGLDDDETSISPLASAYGLMVNGIAYITTDKNILKIVQTYIGVDTLNGKGMEFIQ